MVQRRSTILAAAATAIALSGACTAQAQALYDTLTRSGACFARDYDGAHLRAHPDQTVTHFHLGDPGPDWRDAQKPDHYNVAFAFRITGDTDTYSGIGICQPRGALAACDIESDGGAFTIERRDSGLRIRLTRMQAEGMADFSPDLALRDNRVMLLYPAPSAACPQG
jgi:hypothetical protein